MKNRFKKALATVLTVVIVLSAAPLSGFVGLEIPWLSDLFGIEANAAIDSGSFGDDLRWSTSSVLGTLTIAGSGDMPDWTSASEVPWIEQIPNIKKIKIGSSVKGIGDYAFANCTYVTSVEMSDSLKRIGKYAFYNCPQLESIEILGKVTSIGDYAFASCSKLKSVSIPSTVTSIGNNAFDSCISLATLSIPASVKTIGEYAFCDCTALAIINIPNSVTSIGDSAFYGCNRLTRVTIPASVTSIGKTVFFNCNALKTITVDENNQNYSLDEYGVLFDKEKTVLVQNLMGNNITEYVIPDTVTSIGDYAFYTCNALTSITIPDSVTSMGSYSFYDCSGLTDIAIPDTVTSIGEYAFYNCIGLTSITIPDSATDISFYAFVYCSNVTTVKISSSVTRIGDYAFAYCNSINDVYYAGSEDEWNKIAIGSNNEFITKTIVHFGGYEHSYVFSETKDPTCVRTGKYVYTCECGKSYHEDIPALGHIYHSGICIRCGCAEGFAYEVLEDEATITGYNGIADEVIIPEIINGYPVTSIGEDAFCDNNRITSITIPDSIIEIKARAFKNCKNLEEVITGNSVTVIGDSAFYNCINIKTVSFGNNLTTISEYAFYNCDRLVSMILPSNMVAVGSYAFDNCDNLWHVLHKGSSVAWATVTIGDANLPLLNATHHYRVDVDKVKTQIIESTCTTDGGIYYTCSACYRERFVITETASGHNYVYVETVEPTCANKGYDLYECSGCGENKKDNMVDEAEHILVDGVCLGCGMTDCFDYEIVGGEVIITGCDESLTEIVIPRMIDGYPVTKIYFSEFTDVVALERIIVPETVTEISEDALIWLDYLTGIYVDENNQYYSNDEYGVLYNKEKTELIRYPIGRTDVEYEIPSGVEYIYDYAFSYCQNLLTVRIPDSVMVIGCDAFYCTDSLWHVLYTGDEDQWYSIEVDDGNEILEDYVCFYDETDDISFVMADPTCSDEGYYSYECPVCGKENTIETIPELGHNYYYEETIDPTCTEKGYDLYKCTRCDHEEKRNMVSASGHNYISLGIIEPTCTSGGYTGDLYCSVCEQLIYPGETISALGHSYQIVEKVDSTCGEEGYRKYSCARCDDTYTVSIPAKSHNYELYEKVEATCTESGTEIYKCSFCDSLEYKTIYASHSYNEKGYCIKCEDPYYISAPENTSTVFDWEKGIVSGLPEYLDADSLMTLFSVSDDINVTLSSDAIGTGTKIILTDKDSNELESYTIVIFGDYNGDGAADSEDATYFASISNFEIFDYFEYDYLFMAADINGDGSVDSMDEEDMNAITNFEAYIDHTITSGSKVVRY